MLSDDFGFSTRIVKQVASNISSLLANIFNLSLITGIFPDLPKKANVIALYKSGSPTDPLNYSGMHLSVFSETLEKIAHKQLHNFL